MSDEERSRKMSSMNLDELTFDRTTWAPEQIQRFFAVCLCFRLLLFFLKSLIFNSIMSDSLTYWLWIRAGQKQRAKVCKKITLLRQHFEVVLNHKTDLNSKTVSFSKSSSLLVILILIINSYNWSEICKKWSIWDQRRSQWNLNKIKLQKRRKAFFNNLDPAFENWALWNHSNTTVHGLRLRLSGDTLSISLFLCGWLICS